MQGVLFDMDGILFDTERLFLQRGQQVLEKMGYKNTEPLLLETVGVNSRAAKEILRQGLGSAFDSSDYLRQTSAWVLANNPPLKDGVVELLTFLQRHSFSIAVASSSSANTIRTLLEQGGISLFFTAIVGGDMVHTSKPEPDIFLAAAAALGLPAKACLAIEDSPNGVRSASRAGCITIMIPDLLPATSELKQITAAILPSLRLVPQFIQSHRRIMEPADAQKLEH